MPKFSASLLLILTLVASLCGCGNNNKNQSTSTELTNDTFDGYKLNDNLNKTDTRTESPLFGNVVVSFYGNNIIKLPTTIEDLLTDGFKYCEQTQPIKGEFNEVDELTPGFYSVRLEDEMVTSGELEAVFRKAVEIIIESKDKKEDIRNYAIRRAINFIREHYNENISLDMLAERLEITPEYLSALFNKEVGINFSTFLKQFRISQAKRLLKGSDEKIYTIAQLVGYNDPKYFNRVFKDEVGMSPGDYRQKN